MSTLEAQSRQIGGVTYRVLPLTTKQALRVLTRLLKMAAPAFGDVASLREAAKAAHSALGTALVGLAGDLDDAALVEVTEAFAAVTEADLGGKSALKLTSTWDEHFRGKLFEFFEWLKFCGEVTYAPLWEGLQAMAQPDPVAPEAPPAV